MSFTSDVKNSLLDIKPENTCCKSAFLAGVLTFGGNWNYSGNDAVYTLVSENLRLIEKLRDIVEDIFVLRTEIVMKETKAKLTVRDAGIMLHELDIINPESISIKIPETLRDDCCVRSYIRGAFIGGGSVMNPSVRYHLEFVTSHYTVNNDFQKLFERFSIPTKTLMRKSKYVTYFKDNEIVCDVLALIGASMAAIEVTTTNMKKSIINRNNRIWNFENANLDKTIDAALKQAKAIKKVGIENLPENLREIARLRVENPELNLLQIGQLATPPISKSGVNHKMRKIMKIASEIR